MVSIASTTRPITINNGSNITTTPSETGVATASITDSDNTSNTAYKTNFVTPTINQFDTPSISQQAIKPDTANNSKPEVVYENRYLSNTSTTPVINSNSNLTNSDRNDLSVLTRWASKIRATNNSSQVTTYMDDPSTVPLIRRDTNGFFNVDYNKDGTYHVTTTGIRIPFTDTVVGNYDLGNYSWNPIQAYSVASPIGTYLGNYKYYDTKNKIVQGTLALSNAYSNYYNGANNFVDNYAIKEWGNLVDMSINWKDRNIMQNAIAGLNTITGLSNRYGYNSYLGGDGTVKGINDVLAMYTFGNSIYNLGKYWEDMSVGQKVGATVSTINSGIQAYEGLNSLSGMYTRLYSYINNAGNAGSLTGSAANTGSASTTGSAVTTGSTTNATTGSTTGAASGETAGSSPYLQTAGRVVGAGAAGYSAYNYGKTMGQSDTESGIGGGVAALGSYYGDPYSMSAVFAYQSIKGFCDEGRSTASNRKNGAAAGAASGAAIGSCCGPVGTVVGAVVGAVVGVVSQSGKFGRSREQFHRSLYRDSLTNIGIFERFDKLNEDEIDHGGKTFYQLADGSYYNVGADGSGSRAKDINGNVKKFYNPELIEERDKIRASGEMSPYNIDYTCNMDFTGSLLLAPLNALGLGGSNTRDSGEYGQMLGYMTNAVTSNVGREFTKENFNKMVDNVKAGYERIGITNKMDALESIGVAYMMGRLTDDDYNSYKLALNMLYDNSGYNQAQTLMDQLGRGEQAKPTPIEASSDAGVSEPTEEVSVESDTTVESTPSKQEADNTIVEETVTEEVSQ